jgi:hypothetical protein
MSVVQAISAPSVHYACNRCEGWPSSRSSRWLFVRVSLRHSGLLGGVPACVFCSPWAHIAQPLTGVCWGGCMLQLCVLVNRVVLVHACHTPRPHVIRQGRSHGPFTWPRLH